MSKKEIIRAWKDEEYRQSMSESERESMPENPAGSVELDDPDLDSVVGGIAAAEGTYGFGTAGCCNTILSDCGTSYQIMTYGCCGGKIDVGFSSE